MKKKQQEKLKLAGIIDLRLYEPWEAQYKFHTSDALVRCYSGCNYGGKTHAGAAETIWWSTKTHPYKKWVNERIIPNHVFIVCIDHKQQKQPGGPQDKIVQMLPKHLIKDTQYAKGRAIDYIELHNGAKIFFKTKKGGREGLQGARVTLVWGDEDCIPDGEFYDELHMRLPEDGHLVHKVFTFTPNLFTKKDSWMVENILSDANKPESEIRLWEITLFEVPILSDEQREQIISGLKGDAATIQARVYGDYRARSGKIYELSKDHHIIPALSPLPTHPYH